MSREPTWAEVVLIALNVGQTVALAWISSRSNRVRRVLRQREGEQIDEA